MEHLDMQPYGALKTRAWMFRSVGCGHDVKEWSDMMSALRIYGYDYVVSIEHEDPIMSVEEGFQRAVSNLQSVLIKEQHNLLRCGGYKEQRTCPTFEGEGVSERHFAIQIPLS